MKQRLVRIAAAMESIRRAHPRKRLVKQKVVDAASAKGHPLHQEFDWDDRKMANKARLDRAGQLIRLITVTVTTTPVKITCPAYIRDPQLPPRIPGYVSMTATEFSQYDAQQILLSELTRIESAIERARGAALELEKTHAGILTALQNALERIIGIRARMSGGPPPPPRGGKGKRGSGKGTGPGPGTDLGPTLQ